MAEFWQNMEDDEWMKWQEKGILGPAPGGTSVPQADLRSLPDQGISMGDGTPSASSEKAQVPPQEQREEEIRTARDEQALQRRSQADREVRGVRGIEAIRAQLKGTNYAEQEQLGRGMTSRMNFFDGDENRARVSRQLEGATPEARKRFMSAQLRNPASMRDIRPADLLTVEGRDAMAEAGQTAAGRRNLSQYTADIQKFQERLNERVEQMSDENISLETVRAEARKINQENGSGFDEEAVSQLITMADPEKLRAWKARRREELEVEGQAAARVRGAAVGEYEANKERWNLIYDDANVDGDLIRGNAQDVPAEKRAEFQRNQRAEIQKLEDYLIRTGQMPSTTQARERAAAGGSIIARGPDGYRDERGRAISEEYAEELKSQWAASAREKGLDPAYINALVTDRPLVGAGDLPEESTVQSTRDEQLRAREKVRQYAREGLNPVDVYEEEFQSTLSTGAFQVIWNEAARQADTQDKAEASTALQRLESDLEQRGQQFVSRDVRAFSKGLQMDPDTKAYQMLADLAKQTGAPETGAVDLGNRMDVAGWVIGQMEQNASSPEEKEAVRRLNQAVRESRLDEVNPAVDAIVDQVQGIGKFVQERDRVTQRKQAVEYASKHTTAQGRTPDPASVGIISLGQDNQIGVLRTGDPLDRGLAEAAAATPELIERVKLAGVQLGSYIGDESASQRSVIAPILAAVNSDYTQLAREIAPDSVPPDSAVDDLGLGVNTQPLAALDEKSRRVEDALAVAEVGGEDAKAALFKAIDKSGIPSDPAAKRLFQAGLSKNNPDNIRAAYFLQYRADVKTAQAGTVGSIRKSGLSPEFALLYNTATKTHYPNFAAIKSAYDQRMEMFDRAGTFEQKAALRRQFRALDAQSLDHYKDLTKKFSELGQYDTSEYKAAATIVDFYEKLDIKYKAAQREDLQDRRAGSQRRRGRGGNRNAGRSGSGAGRTRTGRAGLNEEEL